MTGNKTDDRESTDSELTGECSARILGANDHGIANYEIEHINENPETQYQTIRVTAELLGLEVALDFSIDEAEEFIVKFRDEVVRAKQARLEWETDTDPESGIAEEPTDD